MKLKKLLASAVAAALALTTMATTSFTASAAAKAPVTVTIYDLSTAPKGIVAGTDGAAWGSGDISANDLIGLVTASSNDGNDLKSLNLVVELAENPGDGAQVNIIQKTGDYDYAWGDALEWHPLTSKSETISFANYDSGKLQNAYAYGMFIQVTNAVITKITLTGNSSKVICQYEAGKLDEAPWTSEAVSAFKDAESFTVKVTGEGSGWFYLQETYGEWSSIGGDSGMSDDGTVTSTAASWNDFKEAAENNGVIKIVFGDYTSISKVEVTFTYADGTPTPTPGNYVSYEITMDGAEEANLPVTIKVNQTRQLTATVKGVKEDGTKEVITGYGDLFWESKTPSVATVEGGLVTGVSEGTAEIWAYFDNETKPTYCVLVTVEAAEEGGSPEGGDPEGGAPAGGQGGATGGTITGDTDRVSGTTTPVLPAAGTTSASAVEDIVTASEGSTVKVDLKPGATTISSEVLTALAGKNVTVEVDLPGGVYWEINGENVTEANDVNLGVTLNSDNIPENKIEEIAGNNDSMQFSLSHNGDLGFTGTLNIPVSSKYNGQYANLYYYNKNRELEFVGSSQVSGGRVGFVFTHASAYVMIFDTFPYGDDVSSAAAANETETAQAVPYAGIVILTALMCVSVPVIRKRLAK